MLAKRGTKKRSHRRETNNWLLRQLSDKKVSMEELAKLLGVTRKMLYNKMTNPPAYFTLRELILISSRLGIPLRDVIAWCVGSPDHVIEYNVSESYWFE